MKFKALLVAVVGWENDVLILSTTREFVAATMRIAVMSFFLKNRPKYLFRSSRPKAFEVASAVRVGTDQHERAADGLICLFPQA